MKVTFRLVPEAASTLAHSVDYLLLGLLLICGFVLVLVFFLLAYFAIRYRKGSPADRTPMPHSRQIMLELGWTSIPLGIFMALFVWGAVLFYRMHEPPPGATEIHVVGKQWMWKFQHPDGRSEINELHVPVGQPILLSATSQDVIHSLFVPEFRMKQDVLPGRYAYTWFQATKPGTYHLFCTQYCGTDHAGMRGRVIVMSPADYQKWLATGVVGGPIPNGSLASRGEKLFARYGCIYCHGGGVVHAPSLTSVYGHEVPLSNDETVVADENYLRESILNPSAKIVKGYQDVMPPFKGRLSEEELIELIEYIKSLQPEGDSNGR